MDEAAFRQKSTRMNERPCTFENAILSGCVKCSRSDHIQIAEREAVTCLSQSSLDRCSSLHFNLRNSFSFALKIGPTEKPVLTHSQEKKVQCGGLLGIQYVLHGGTREKVDVDGLLEAVIQKWGNSSDIPYSEVVHAATTTYKGR